VAGVLVKIGVEVIVQQVVWCLVGMRGITTSLGVSERRLLGIAPKMRVECEGTTFPSAHPISQFPIPTPIPNLLLRRRRRW
jgi:hypothetical protein